MSQIDNIEKEKFIKLVNKKKFNIPLKRQFLNENNIRRMFDNLSKFNYVERIMEHTYSLRNINITPKFKGKYLLILSKKSDYFDINMLSDMFNERARLNCTVIGSKYSPHNFFYKFPHVIYDECLKKYGKITKFNIRETLYDSCKECSIFRPTHMVVIVKLFDSKCVLDFSSGWGDRLIGAMASNVDFYCGVDPNPDLVNGYNDMINFFNYSTKRFVMVESPFETAVIPKMKYDLVFTSPPFFNIEIYKKDQLQSSKYEDEREWFEKFLKVSIKKAVSLLIPNGILALSINQKKNNRYIYWMLDYVKKEIEVNFLGVISYCNSDFINPQPIFIWKKK
jgi:hypothetical protein